MSGFKNIKIDQKLLPHQVQEVFLFACTKIVSNPTLCVFVLTPRKILYFPHRKRNESPYLKKKKKKKIRMKKKKKEKGSQNK